MNEIISELEKLAAEAKEKFGRLSVGQINWKPNAESWSIGQCLEHLIKSNELYFEDFKLIAEGNRKSSLIEKWSPLAGFFGDFVASMLKKDSQKSKTIEKAVPPSQIDSEITDRFLAHQAELINKIESLQNVDPTKVKLTSPFLKIATYSLKDAFYIIIEHEKRHFRQAERILETEGFPK